jgi:hypothetical protein
MSRTAETRLLGLVQSEDYSAEELELMKERASALGHAGEKLSEALNSYNRTQDESRRDELCDEAAYRLWALVVQREALGLALGNEKWIRQSFAVPAEVWRRYQCI